MGNQFVMKTTNTWELRLSNSIGEGERGRVGKVLRYNTRMLQYCRKFVCAWKCTNL